MGFLEAEKNLRKLSQLKDKKTGKGKRDPGIEADCRTECTV